ncbi:MAG TPA: hypothetical protein PKC99_18295, partial [Anaerolineales bacterium]|nr:hypothetical protein [Anaerolineales bacterium]
MVSSFAQHVDFGSPARIVSIRLRIYKYPYLARKMLWTIALPMDKLLRLEAAIPNLKTWRKCGKVLGT